VTDVVIDRPLPNHNLGCATAKTQDCALE